MNIDSSYGLVLNPGKYPTNINISDWSMTFKCCQVGITTL